MDLINSFKDFVSNIVGIGTDIVDSIKLFFRLFAKVISMIPQPFSTILATFSLIMVGIIVYKIIKQ